MRQLVSTFTINNGRFSIVVFFIGVETTEEIDPLKLEQSLCHVLMDKALLNCLLLLDKADMESRIKTLDVQTFDYTGISTFHHILISSFPQVFRCFSPKGDRV